MRTKDDITAEELRAHLHRGVVKLSFTKADGSVRDMLCTLDADLIRQQFPEEDDPSFKSREEPAGMFTVLDVEVGGWRRFKFDNIISIDID